MDTWPGVAAPGDPPQPRADLRERVMHGAIVEGRASIGDEEGLDTPIAHVLPASLRLLHQRGDGGGMYRHEARFAKFRVSHSERGPLQIHIRGGEREGLG